MVLQTVPSAIAMLSPAALEAYFQGFNSEDYDAVAALFATEGILRPPFEEGIMGTAAIRAYLAAEAKGMRATPLEAEVTALDSGERQITVKGRVKALVFTVNVQWVFVLSHDEKILDAHIKLLASLQELMQMNQGGKTPSQA